MQKKKTRSLRRNQNNPRVKKRLEIHQLNLQRKQPRYVLVWSLSDRMQGVGVGHSSAKDKDRRPKEKAEQSKSEKEAVDSSAFSTVCREGRQGMF